MGWSASKESKKPKLQKPKTKMQSRKEKEMGVRSSLKPIEKDPNTFNDKANLYKEDEKQEVPVQQAGKVPVTSSSKKGAGGEIMKRYIITFINVFIFSNLKIKFYYF